MRGFSTPHTRDTTAPQNYWGHAKVAVGKSFGLMWLGLAGVVHGVLPEIKGLQFYTSTGILKASRYLMFCGRHDAEIEAIFGKTYLSLIKRQRNCKSNKLRGPNVPRANSPR